MFFGYGAAKKGGSIPWPVPRWANEWVVSDRQVSWLRGLIAATFPARNLNYRAVVLSEAKPHYSGGTAQASHLLPYYPFKRNLYGYLYPITRGMRPSSICCFIPEIIGGGSLPLAPNPLFCTSFSGYRRDVQAVFPLPPLPSARVTIRNTIYNGSLTVLLCKT